MDFVPPRFCSGFGQQSCGYYHLGLSLGSPIILVDLEPHKDGCKWNAHMLCGHIHCMSPKQCFVGLSPCQSSHPYSLVYPVTSMSLSEDSSRVLGPTSLLPPVLGLLAVTVCLRFPIVSSLLSLGASPDF